MTYSKDHPFNAKIVNRSVLNAPGSKKCTVHLTLDISGSNLKYKVGDSIAVFPQNSSVIVKETLKYLGLSGHEVIEDTRRQDTCTIEEFLTKRANISKVTKKWLTFLKEKVSDLSNKEKIEQLIESKEHLKPFCEAHHIWDCVKTFAPVKASAQEVANHLLSLLPRFYSIASSQLKTHHEVDLLIAYFKYSTNEHLRFGVASHYLCEAAQMHTPCIPMYVHPSKDFTLPKDPNAPIIMVGPGTGVAPFRAFMQERVALNAEGKNWLFFGDWNESFDFLYADEWKAYEKQGVLKLSTAFSRDQKEKVYVQDQMKLHAKELWSWISQGAYFYVCGDAQHMAKDVDSTLHQIIENEGNKTPEEAKAFVKELKNEKRYVRDVY